MEEMPKIQIADDADKALDSMLAEVNDGFTSGRVKKPQLASWIIAHFQEKLFRQQIKQIRADHFDEIAHLKSVVKKLEEAKTTKERLELGELLSPLLQRQRSNPRSVSKPSKDEAKEENS